MVKLSRWPPAPNKRFAAFGFGIIISNDNQLKGISVLLGLWQINVGFLEAFFLSAAVLIFLILKELF